MKLKTLSILVALTLSTGYTYAQGEVDAYRLSRNNLTGTARSVAMGGAFGALGGDISGIAINPAGIGIYKTSEVVTTMNFQSAKTETQMKTTGGPKSDQSKFKFSFDNLGFVGIVPTGNSDVVPLVNFGFSYNRVMNFDRKYRLQGDNINSSIASYMARRANSGDYVYDNPNYHLYVDNYGKNEEGIYAFDDYDWMALLGYNSHLITHLGSGNYEANRGFVGSGIYNDLNVTEKGSIDTYDFNVGTTFADIVSFGLTVSVTDLNYRLYSTYEEALDNTQGNGFLMDNWLHTDGTGWQIKTGLIFKPVHELRIGLAYHSPTWYNMTDHYGAGIDYNMAGIPAGVNRSPDSGDVYSGDYGPADYKFRSPDKFIASVAGVIGQIAIISADYEFTNYKNSMKLFDRNGDNLRHAPNEAIKEHYKGSSTVRVGAEVRVTPQFALRAGYAWMQSPLVKDFKDGSLEAETVGSDSHYILDGDTHHITWGAGYRFTKNFYTDVAFVMKNRKSDLYTFDMSDKAEIKDKVFQGLLTLGVRF